FAKAATFDDPHRHLLADIKLFAQLSEMDASNPQVWGPMYLAGARALLEALRKNTHEPSRWNMLGVAVYELGQTTAAEKAFKAVKALQPDHANLRGNLKAVRERRHRQMKLPFGPALSRQIISLGEHTSRLAKTVRP